jgi:hypothetical protein
VSWGASSGWAESGLIGHFIPCVVLLVVVLGLVSLHARLVVESVLVFGEVGRSSPRRGILLETVVICIRSGWDGSDGGWGS